MQINATRLHATIAELRKIGADEHGQGTSRMAGSAAEIAARGWFIETCARRGIRAYEDAVGNVIARIGPVGRAVITGSHLDSVPSGGYLDGALGVLCGLEALTVIQESALPLQRPLEVIAFFDEEGRFGSMIGSKTLAGRLTNTELERAQDETGRYLTELLASRGSNIKDVLALKRAPDDVYAFLELHIEQGPVLEAAQSTIGIVEHITGIVRWRAQFSGEANHAGTTPMDMRKDAFRGLMHFANRLDEVCQTRGDKNTRYTIGRVQLSPNYVGVVPRLAEFTLDLRDASGTRLDELNQVLLDSARSIAGQLGLAFSVDVHGHHEPTQCDRRLAALIEQVSMECDLSHQRMLSGALHDAASMAHLGPVGMIFVPSVGGVSHSDKEHTTPADIADGAQVLLRCLSTLLTEEQ